MSPGGYGYAVVSEHQLLLSDRYTHTHRSALTSLRALSPPSASIVTLRPAMISEINLSVARWASEFVGETLHLHKGNLFITTTMLMIFIIQAHTLSLYYMYGLVAK